ARDPGRRGVYPRRFGPKHRAQAQRRRQRRDPGRARFAFESAHSKHRLALHADQRVERRQRRRPDSPFDPKWRHHGSADFRGRSAQPLARGHADIRVLPRRSGMNNRVVTLSLFMAAAAVFMVSSYVNSIEDESRKKFGTEVLVVKAKRDIKEA